MRKVLVLKLAVLLSLGVAGLAGITLTGPVAAARGSTGLSHLGILPRNPAADSVVPGVVPAGRRWGRV
jgi:hypothetical protein